MNLKRRVVIVMAAALRLASRDATTCTLTGHAPTHRDRHGLPCPRVERRPASPPATPSEVATPTPSFPPTISATASSLSPTPAPTPTATPTPATVRLALDWTPNTNHTGFFVAQSKGWYSDAGIALKIIPYTETTPETLIAAGQAECGISFQDSLTFAYAAGAPITSVMAILQHTASAIAVLASGPIARPRDLDGKTYGGFGYPADDPTIKVVIKHDGGKGQFRT